MTETEKKALALVNAVCAEWEVSPATEDEMDGSACFAALTRAIERHEAFRQEVSDVCEGLLACTNANKRYGASLVLNRFIIPKPDPLVDAVDELWTQDRDKAKYMADQLHKYLAARGLEVRKIGESE